MASIPETTWESTGIMMGTINQLISVINQSNINNTALVPSYTALNPLPSIHPSPQARPLIGISTLLILCLVADLHEAVTGPSLKAGDITLLLEWMPTSAILGLPSGRADSRWFEMLELVTLVSSSSHLQVSFAA
jgi:hypothetical protein